MAAEELAGRIGQTAEACEALGVARSTLYRRRQPVTPKPTRRPRPHRGDSGGFEFLEFFLPYTGFFEFRDKAVFRALGFQPMMPTSFYPILLQ